MVEDNPGDARLVELYLHEDPARPFKVVKAARLSEGLAALQAQPIDVVLLDLSLPDSFGMESLARLRAASPSVPVVVLTGTSDEGLALEALRQGAQDYLVKGQGDGELVRRAIRYAIGRSTADAALRQSESRFRALFDNAGTGVVLSDARGAYIHCNPAFCAMVGYSDAELQTMTYRDLTHPDDIDTHSQMREDMMAGRIDSYELTKRYIRRDGAAVWVRLTITAMREGSDNELRFTVAVVEDVTEKKRLEDHMRLAATVFESTGEGLFVTDEKRRIIHVNPAFTELTGYPADEVIGRTPKFLASGRHKPEFYDQVFKTLAETGKWQGEIWNRRKTGEMFAEWLNISVVRDERGDLTNYVAVFSDITSRKQDEERLNYQANHDPLTRLPNRTLFQERLSRALTRAHRNQTIVALLFIDLDFFKQVNDTLGHLAGDILLQQVAERLSSCVRQGDTVARLAGDEFTVILEEITEPRDCAVVAHKILSLMAEPFDLQGHEARISSSIGVALYPSDSGDAQTLIKLADAAMYRAKHQGRNACRFHSESINAQAFERLALESALRHAVERQEFLLHYQPIFDARSGQVVAVEALLRWRHQDFGLIMPNQFLPLAEETGLIGPVGKFVLEEACRQTKSWLDAGYSGLKVGVNLSNRQLRAPELIEDIASALEASGLPPGALELDVPESAIIDKGQDVDAIFTQFKSLGVRMAIDAFGSGYSSFSFLRKLPSNTLKIDQGFVRDAAAGAEESEIVTAIVAVARGLHLSVVAPSIETEEQLAHLGKYDFDMVQGFLFAHPMPAEELTEFLRSGKRPSSLPMKMPV
ncbi:diguanylate cyclase/phosphodiesterase (GGDEF & EAL domains) with PAS/PAC sensor(s) [Paramagnetospirillum magnetotacticum MS-1]|uniref:Diguanylate cyclase/phosphodiesterase (GGDEF & EAL domains) with PAS/PAC sensor(S) n=1 Tax=Paramagnetospirillum magnetotacticum MS-1 TaxID=272627 RepID=A0A0C2V012_PARME|nr:diguanylate cyclase/phosphodiesterase (GGDEF & EAL domains) with PAS/PAC sensor(s) [Paramagnetospirillum magnetotacticum MS-1]